MPEPHVIEATIKLLQDQAERYRAEIARLEMENERLKKELHEKERTD